MGYLFNLLPTSFSLSIGGGVQETFNGSIYGIGAPYSFSPAALINGTGAGKAQFAVLNGQIQLQAVANPTAAPTLATATTGGTIAASTYTLEYTYYNGTGETIGSPTAQQITTGSTSTVTVTAPALPAGATGINVYLTAGGSGTGKVGTAASNAVTLTAMTPTGALPSSTLSTATIATTFDLTNVQSPGRTFDFSGADHSGGGGGAAGGTGGVKFLWIEQTDTTPGQVVSFTSPSNYWSNGLGTARPPMNVAPAATGWFDGTGRQVTSGNKIIGVQALYNTPILNVVLAGEGSWL